MRRGDREITDITELEEIIQKADVCRIALSNDDIPYIVTLNFGYVSNPEKALFFHCAGSGKKIDMIRRNNYACFEMDIDHEIYKGPRGCDWGSRFRSIVGYGKIEIVSDINAKLSGMNCIMSHYGDEKEYTYDDSVFEHTTILRLDIIEMNGKRK